jgi:hypothetical protein
MSSEKQVSGCRSGAVGIDDMEITLIIDDLTPIYGAWRDFIPHIYGMLIMDSAQLVLTRRRS